MFEKSIFSYRLAKLMERALKLQLAEEGSLNPLKCYWLQYQERDQRSPGGHLESSMGQFQIFRAINWFN